jgi:predicted aminopeptidase
VKYASLHFIGSKIQPERRVRKVAAVALAGVVMMVLLSGCEGLHFYRQAVVGEYGVLAHRQPLEKLMADCKTPPRLKAKFERVMKIRKFAKDVMKEPVDDEYASYTDLHRQYVVWNVNIAPGLSLDAKTWWFPVVGRASYRGYFNEKDAQNYAEAWRKKGWDVYVDGIQAYSTLGWFHDPLLNTFIYEPEASLADLIFHELGHRRLFVAGDTDFNEAFAMEVAAEGVKRWFAAQNDPKSYKAYLEAQDREKIFIGLVMSTRSELKAMYGNARLDDAQKLRRKEEILAGLRARYAAARKSWGGCTGYDEWFANSLNNAKLNTVATYYELRPAFRALLEAKNGDMEKFFKAVEALGKLPLDQRHAALKANLKSAASHTNAEAMPEHAKDKTS